MKLHKKVLSSIVGLGLLLSGTHLFAAEKTAKDVVRQAYAQMSKLDNYAFKAHVVDNEAEDDGSITQYKHDVTVTIDRPNKMRVETKSATRNRTSYINNGAFTMMDNDFAYYGQLKTPKSIDGALDFIFDKYGIRTPLASLMYTNMNKRLKFKNNKYFGVVNVSGEACDYVAFKTGTKEVHIWISAGETPLVKTYSIIDTSTKPYSRTNTTLTWDTNPKLSDSDFVFVAPKGATKISINSAN